MNEFTDFDSHGDMPDQLLTPWNFPCLTWSQRVPRCGQKLRRNVRAQKFRLKMCGATQCKPNRSKSTAHEFDRGCVSVAACSIWSHAYTCIQLSAMRQQSSSQRIGALSLIPSCLGISGHPSGSRQGHPRYTGARSAGRPWVAPNYSSAQQTVQIHGKHGSGALAARALVTRVCCVMADPETKNPLR